jgi:hypothetical protein
VAAVRGKAAALQRKPTSSDEDELSQDMSDSSREVESTRPKGKPAGKRGVAPVAAVRGEEASKRSAAAPTAKAAAVPAKAARNAAAPKRKRDEEKRSSTLDTCVWN